MTLGIAVFWLLVQVASRPRLGRAPIDAAAGGSDAPDARFVLAHLLIVAQVGLCVAVAALDAADRVGFAWIGVAFGAVLAIGTRSALRELEPSLAPVPEPEDRSFVRALCHETCTPLGAIAGYADVLLTTKVGAATRKSMLRKIRRMSHALADQIRDLLELEGGEGALAVDDVDVDLARLVGDVHAVAAPEARRLGVAFTIRVVERLPRRIRSDARLIRAALGHLVRNALKCTPPGGTVSIELASGRAADGGTERLTIAVVDDGPEMAAADVERLLRGPTVERGRGGGGGGVRSSGVGVGLPLARRVAEALGGALQLLPRGAGGMRAEFEIAVVVDGADAEAIDAGMLDPELLGADRDDAGVERGALVDRRVLLVEDGPENREFLRHFLQEAGAEVDCAVHGKDGLEVLALDPRRFDVVLMDMDMPVMNGYEATREIRRRSWTVPIIAVTANSLDEDQKDCFDAGCDDFLSKPVNPRLLVDKCVQFATAVPAVGTADSAAADPDGSASGAADGVVAPRSFEPMRSSLADTPALAPLLAGYVEALPGIADEIREARRSDDVDRLHTLVHRLKGSGGQYGYATLSEWAGTCQFAIRDGAPRARVDELVDTVLACIDAVVGPDAATTT